MKKYPNIFVERKKHRNKQQLLIKFDYNNDLINIIRKIDGALWSTSLKCWYLPDTDLNLEALKRNFDKITKLTIQNSTKKTPFKRNLSADEKVLLNNFYLYLKGKRYSKSTIQTYTFFVADFINFHTKTALNELTNKSVELFIESVFIERNYSISSQRQFISALKLFIVFYPETLINNLELVRPKKSKKLPNILSQEEVLKIIGVTQNLKHKAILALIYSCGLRISELIN